MNHHARRVALVWLSLGVGAAAWSPPSAGLPDCEDLMGFDGIKKGAIDSAELLATNPGGTEFCKVLGHLSPKKGSHINFVVNLPASWNGRFLMLGDGGHDGAVSTSTAGIDDGYATANSDMGHDANEFPGATFAFDQPDKKAARAREKDYGSRAVHETVKAAKQIIEAFYGHGPHYSYFNGCSTGGREAHMEVQRYPEDFDGVVDGAAAFHLTGLAMEQNWSMQQTFATDIGGKHTLLAAAVKSQCDGVDGLVDGLIDDPRQCDFDPASLLCGAGQDPAVDPCLSAEQAEAIQAIYDGPSNSKGPIYQGKPMGSEGFWNIWIIPPPAGFAAQGGFVFEFMNYLFFKKDPGTPAEFDWREFDFEADPKKGKFMAKILDATDPDISKFTGKKGKGKQDKGRNGKIIFYHGWADGLIPPFRTVEYYEEVVARNGGSYEETQESARLFMVPGMDHCGAFGVGLQVADWLAPLVSWVELGTPPDRIIASQSLGAGVPPRTRPLCPYPWVARYDGTGSTDEAENFSCVDPGD